MSDNNSVIERNNLSLRTKICFGVGHIFNDLCAAIWFSYMLFYLQIILQMNSSLSGILVMLGQIVDALSTPLSGWAIDKYGEKKVWHIFGTILVICSFPTIFSFCFYCNETITKFLYFSILISMFQIGWAIVQITHLSLIPIIANTSKERSDLTTIRYISSVFSSVTVYIVVGLILHIHDDGAKYIGPQDYFKFRDIVLIIVIIGLIFSIIFYIGVTSKNGYSKIEDDNSDERSSINKMDTLKQAFSSKTLYQVSFLYVASRLYVTLNLIYMPLYLDERQTNNDIIGQSKISVAIVPLFSYLSSFFASLILKFRLKFLNDKVAYLIGSCFSLTSCIWIAFFIIPHSNIWHIYFVAILIGIGSTTTMISSLCITAELISSRIGNSAFIYSTVTFFDKLICGIAVVLIEYIKCKNRKMCPNYYQSIMSYLSSCAVILGLFVLLTLFLKKSN